MERTAGLVAGTGTPGAFWQGPHLVSLGGNTLDLQDTDASWEHFGGPSTKDAAGKRLRGTFPQARLLALAECGTRALIAAACSACATGEKTLTAGLLPRLQAGMLVLADRNFPGCELWRDAAATGAELLWRIGASFTLPAGEVLADGTYLSPVIAGRLEGDHLDPLTRQLLSQLQDRAGRRGRLPDHGPPLPRPGRVRHPGAHHPRSLRHVDRGDPLQDLLVLLILDLLRLQHHRALFTAR
jgi:hypothetical protein